jgi:uncharacterized protein
MAANADTLKQGYEAFNKGDLEGAMANFADDIRWENPEAPMLPLNGVYEGKEAVQKLFIETASIWEEFKIEPDEMVESGDTVVVLSHSEAKARETGKQVKLPWVHVWKFSGDQVKEVLALTDTALAADALGKI